MADVKKTVMILASVPSCPYCAGGLRKLFYEKEVFYKCSACKVMFRIKDFGHYEHELVCEEVDTI